MTIGNGRPADETLGDQLRRHRTRSGLTQEELAERAGISARAVSDIERGLRTRVYRHTAWQLAEALDLPATERDAFAAAARRRPLADGHVAHHRADATGRSSGLPSPLTGLVGRHDQLEALLGDLRDPGIRVVTVSGPGGIGKTRLAIEAARAVYPDFADGAIFVQLAVTNDPELVPSLIARELRLTAVRKPIADSVRDHLRDRQILVVLDTFEHLLPAAAYVSELAIACPRVTILVASRTALRVRGEHEIRLAPLAVPDATVRRPDLRSYSGTALFLDRAREVDRHLVVDDAIADTVADICRRLDGFPLAIELAAVRLRSLPLAALRDQLDRRLDVLVDGPRDLPDRQRAMRATIAWSYELLGPTEQRLFRGLSAFTGGWTLETAASVCREPGTASDLLVAMSSLVDSNLIAPWHGTATDAPRWRMLDVIREFANEKASSHGEAIDLAERHAFVFTALAEVAEPELGGSNQEAWSRRLAAEQDNFRAAIAWSLLNRMDLAQRLAGALWQFWRGHGDYPEARRWLDAALAEPLPGARASAEPNAAPLSADGGALRRKVLWGDAWISYYQGDYRHAGRLGDELLRSATSVDDQVGIRHGLTMDGMIALAEGRIDGALAPLEAAVRICRTACQPWLLSTSLLVLGMATLHGNDLARSRTLLRESAAGYRSLGDETFLARSTGYLGYAALSGGDPEIARRLLRRSLRTFARIGERFGIAEALQALAALEASVGDGVRAAELAGAAHAIWSSMSAQPLAPDRAMASRFLDPARRHIGAASWRSAWRRGGSLTVDQAVDRALQRPER